MAPQFDPRTAATYYQLGLIGYDPIRRRFPGADAPVPTDERRRRLRDLIERCRGLAKR
jgi:hypothetical protein